MTLKLQNDTFLRALRGEKTSYTPIWMMRQAGRTDPAYLALKEEAGLPLEDLFRHPAYATEITLLPKRFGVDALIYFQDILTPLTPMGAHFVFAPGPKLVDRVDSVADVDKLHGYDVERELPFVRQTFASIFDTLEGELPVLGFAGSPLTLAVFILEGKSFGETASRAMSFMAEQPEALHRLLERITAMTIDYLTYQARCGVAAVQLFESAAFLLTPAQYHEFALPYQQRIFAAMKGIVPTINFAREWNSLADLDAAGADVISLPSTIHLRDARAQLGAHRIFQGNVDNHLLAHGTEEAIAAAVEDCVLAGGHQGHLFNLSHGLLRETPFERVLRLVEQVHAVRCPEAGEVSP
jgi:uroporphyrinogen decarboxylase